MRGFTYAFIPSVAQARQLPLENKGSQVVLICRRQTRRNLAGGRLPPLPGKTELRREQAPALRFAFLSPLCKGFIVGADSISPRLNAFLTQQLPLHTQGEPIGLFYFLKRGEHAVCVKGYIVVWIVLKVRHCKFAQVLVTGEGTVGGDL